MQPASRTGLALLALATLIAMPPMADAQILNAQVGGFGTVVKVGDPDYVPLTKSAVPVGASHYDMGTPTEWTDDCVILDKSTTAGPGVDDLYLTPCFGKVPGSKVQQVDNRALTSPFRTFSIPNGNLSLRYIDLNDNNGYDTSEPVYMTTKGNASGATGFDPTNGVTWTLRLTAAFGKAAGTFVMGADTEPVTYLTKMRLWPGAASNGQYTFPTLAEREDKGWYLMPTNTTSTGLLLPVKSIRVGLAGTTTLQPGITVTAFELGNPDAVEAGTPFPVVVTIANTGPQAGVGLVITKVDKQLADVRMSPLLAPGEQTKVIVNVLAPHSGALDLEVNDLFHVINAKGAPATPPTTASDPGLTPAQVAELQARVAALETRVANSGNDEVVEAKGSPGVAGIATLAALVLVGAVLRRRDV